MMYEIAARGLAAVEASRPLQQDRQIPATQLLNGPLTPPEYVEALTRLERLVTHLRADVEELQAALGIDRKLDA